MSLPPVRGGFPLICSGLHSNGPDVASTDVRTFQHEHLNNGCLCAVRRSAVSWWATIAPRCVEGPSEMTGAISPKTKVVVATTVMLSFISFWRAGGHRLE